MRDIRFRAWDKSNKEMFYSDFVIQANGKLVWWLPTRGYLWERDDVVPMQHTGLHDKNGKEIYEGDIVRIDGCSGLVEVFFGGVSFRIKGNFEGSYILDPLRIDKYEVIGNIYENPGLLKEAK